MKDIDRLQEAIKTLTNAEPKDKKAQGFRYDDAGLVRVMCELLFFDEDGNLLQNDARADRSGAGIVEMLTDTVMRYTAAGEAIRKLRSDKS